MASPEVRIDADALVHNFQELKRVSGVALMPVIKADAYGHGAGLVASLLEKTFNEADLPYLCVARVNEVQDLRKAGVSRAALVLSHFAQEEVQDTDFPKNTHLVLSSHRDLRILESLPVETLAKITGIHLNLNTGMNRLGFRAFEEKEDFARLLENIQRILQMGLSIEGICSHLARSEEDPQVCTQLQVQRFEKFVERLRLEWPTFAASVPFPRWIHLSNSASTPRKLLKICNAVRPGIFLWGAFQDESHKNLVSQEFKDFSLKPVMQVRSPIRQLFWIQAGEGVGYGHRFVATKPHLIATINLGYADGLPRAISRAEDQAWKTGFVIDGVTCPIAGTVSMDMTMVDLTDHPRREQLLHQYQTQVEAIWAYWIGQGQSAERLAESLGTIAYEIFCDLSRRLPRRLLKDSK